MTTSLCCNNVILTKRGGSYCSSCGKDVVTPVISLEFHNTLTGITYRVTFEGDNAERMAVGYIGDVGKTHAVWELESDPFDYQDYPALTERLYPTCPHGLSLSLCAHPLNHYPTEQMMMGGYY